MRAPAFWWSSRPTPVARLLSGVGAAYGAVTAARMDRPGARLPVPVVCVGNLVAGGAGKTPVALALARLLIGTGCRPAFLSRGYGRAGRGLSEVLAVDPGRHTAAEAGDEPLLLARVAHTFVSGDRLAAARAAMAAGAELLILDDGLQNPRLAKNLVVAVVDGGVGHGNGLCIPAGPLRAPARRQWPHVSLLCCVGAGQAGARVAAEAGLAGVPALGARLVPDAAVLERLRTGRWFAFAGIGRPAKFFETLAAAGIDVVGRHAFPDHHAYAAGDLDGLRREAARAGAALVTTVKDGVRLPAGFAEALPVDLVFEDEPAILDALRGVWPV